LFEARTGQQMALGRRWRVETSLASLMRERGLTNLDHLVSRLVSGAEPALRDQVVDALLNNETYFFRDRLPFETLLAAPLKRIEQARAKEKRISIWCAGCSTGQEPYSLAMSFAEEKLRWHGWKIDIVATDLSGTAIGRARDGLYSQFEVQRGLAVTQMLRWFSEEGGDWRIAPDLRRMVRFEQRSILEAPPLPARFDIILCRNLLLYLTPERRRLAFEGLGRALAPDGLLMLGAGETVIGQTERFRLHPEHRGLYAAAPPAAAMRPRLAAGA
jgi:chemotaxis protein methyltransferase CheR